MIRKIFIVLLLINSTKTFPQPVYFEDYMTITNDTIVENGFAVTKRFGSENAVKQNKGEIRAISRFSDEKLYFKRIFYSKNIFYSHYFEYNENNLLSVMRKYDFNNNLEQVVYFLYKNGKVTESISEAQKFTYRVEYVYDNCGRIAKQTMYKNNYKFMVMSNSYSETPGIIRTYRIVTDTTSAFMKKDTLETILFDSVTKMEFSQNAELVFKIKYFDNKKGIKRHLTFGTASETEVIDFKYKTSDNIIREEKISMTNSKKASTFFERTTFESSSPLKFPSMKELNSTFQKK